jgi:hypothetical protein
MMRLLRGVALASIVAFAAAGAVACDDNDASSENSASQASVEELTARTQRNEMMVAAITIGKLPLHDMNEAIDDGNVESTFIPDTRLLIRVLALTDWSDALQADADTLRGHAVELLAALDNGDVEAAKPHATETHEGWHQFAPDIWAELTAGLPPEAGGPEEHDEGETTPGATMPGAGEHDESTPADDGGATPAGEPATAESEDDHDATPPADSSQ